MCHRLIFRWLAIPFVQAELDAYRFRHNNSKKRANRHTFLPQGIPENIFRNSASVRAQDFKVRNIFHSLTCPIYYL